MVSAYEYRILSQHDRVALMSERLHDLEAQHFKLTLELRLAGVLGPDEDIAAQVKLQLTGMEVQATALAEWLGATEAIDA